MATLKRELREPLPTFRVYSDDLETFYGRVQQRDGHWYVLPESRRYDTRRAAQDEVLGRHARMNAVVGGRS